MIPENHFPTLLLDGLGQLTIVFLILWLSSLFGFTFCSFSFFGDFGWLSLAMILYAVLGWLFGTYTVLRWRQISLFVLLQRLLITAVAVVFFLSVFRSVFNSSNLFCLANSGFQSLWMLSLSIWALIVRLGLRRRLLSLFLLRCCC